MLISRPYPAGQWSDPFSTSGQTPVIIVLSNSIPGTPLCWSAVIFPPKYYNVEVLSFGDIRRFKNPKLFNWIYSSLNQESFQDVWRHITSCVNEIIIITLAMDWLVSLYVFVSLSLLLLEIQTLPLWHFKLHIKYACDFAISIVVQTPSKMTRFHCSD